MSIQAVKFNRKDRPEFFKVLRNRVNQHFQENNISKHANFEMVFKSVFMVCLYTIPLILMLTGVVASFWGVMAMWTLMGFGMSGIGLAVMHDANHGSYSSNPRVNKVVSYVINLIGGFHTNWRIQHNVLHHSFTNVHEHDDDISKGIMRFSPDQERKGVFRFQAYYAPILYALMTVYWLLLKDFQQLYKYSKQNLIEAQGLTTGEAFVYIIFNKAWYVGLTIVLPIMLIDLPWTSVMAGFFIMHFICGLVLALIFQPAHVIEETDFFKTDEDGNLENNWAIHQMRTTSNFAHKSVLFSWFVGGLNYQVEHHLFPNICHVHYKDISSIVKSTAKEYGIPYHEHETFFDAVKSHFTLLNQLGTGSYDRKKALQAAKAAA